MSWGTSYKYEGYLSHIGKRDINSKREECKKINDMMWSEILAYMSMTPPVYAKDDEGNEYPWAEFVAIKLREFRDEIEENDMLIARLDDCGEAMHEDPDNVIEG